MTISLCRHSFPVQPPRGSLAHPGDCADEQLEAGLRGRL